MPVLVLIAINPLLMLLIILIIIVVFGVAVYISKNRNRRESALQNDAIASENILINDGQPGGQERRIPTSNSPLPGKIELVNALLKPAESTVVVSTTDLEKKVYPSEKKESQLPVATIAKPQRQRMNSESKLALLVKELAGKGHPEYPLLRKEYAVTSGMPYKDFSRWVITQLKERDYTGLYAFIKELYLGSSDPNDNRLKQDFSTFISKDFKSLFTKIDGNAIFEIQAFFILRRGIDDFNREFWIADGHDAELLAKILSVYDFDIQSQSFEPLIKKANKFLREMKKDNDYWKDYKTYKLEELPVQNQGQMTTQLAEKLKELTPGERLHFFDFAKYSATFWNGDSSAKTRGFGINENESLESIARLDIFEASIDINSIPQITSKGELKESAEKAGFNIKKSWGMDKIFENLMKDENGQSFLKDFISQKTVLLFRQEFAPDISCLFEYQARIKRTVDLIAMM